MLPFPTEGTDNILFVPSSQPGLLYGTDWFEASDLQSSLVEPLTRPIRIQRLLRVFHLCLVLKARTNWQLLTCCDLYNRSITVLVT